MKGSIRRRGKNGWELTIDLGKDAQGKRRRKFLNVTGKKPEAQRRLREILAQIDRGIPFDTSKLTVAEYLDQWFRTYVVPNTRPRTAEGYEGILRNHLKPHIGQMHLAKLQPADIQAMESRILESGRSPTTVQHIHRVLHTALKHAVKWGLLWRNPAEAVDRPKVETAEIQIPGVNEVLAILEASKTTSYHAAYHLMAFTGCRRGECLGLRWEDVDLDRNQLSIVQTIQRVNQMGIVTQPPKSKKSRRSIAIDPTTIEVLRAHKVRQLEHRLRLGDAWMERGLVFPGSQGEPLDPSTLTHTWRKLTTIAEVQKVRLHDLRHFHASLLLREGTHPKVVQERLGHSTISTTLDTYSHVVPSMQVEAAGVFEGAMAKATNE